MIPKRNKIREENNKGRGLNKRNKQDVKRVSLQMKDNNKVLYMKIHKKITVNREKTMEKKSNHK